MSLPIQTFYKDPDGTETYSIDWSKKSEGASVGSGYLGAETIGTSAWTVPSGITKASESNTTLVSTVKLSGGTDNTDYLCTCRITTSGGRTTDRTILVQVREQ